MGALWLSRARMSLGMTNAGATPGLRLSFATVLGASELERSTWFYAKSSDEIDFVPARKKSLLAYAQSCAGYRPARTSARISASTRGLSSRYVTPNQVLSVGRTHACASARAMIADTAVGR